MLDEQLPVPCEHFLDSEFCAHCNPDADDAYDDARKRKLAEDAYRLVQGRRLQNFPYVRTLAVALGLAVIAPEEEDVERVMDIAQRLAEGMAADDVLDAKALAAEFLADASAGGDAIAMQFHQWDAEYGGVS